MKKLILGMALMVSFSALAIQGTVSPGGTCMVGDSNGNGIQEGRSCSYPDVTCNADGSCSFGGQAGTVVNNRRKLEKANSFLAPAKKSSIGIKANSLKRSR